MHYMHLLKKWSKYAFAYAHMQMHNYPKPSEHISKSHLNRNNRLLLSFG